MSFAASLLSSRSFLSFSAPGFVWIAALGIAAGTIEEVIRLYQLVGRERRLYEEAAAAISRRAEHHPGKPLSGLSADGYEALREDLEKRPRLRSMWRNYRDGLIRERSIDGGDSYWAEASAADAFSKTVGFGSDINWKWFAAVPGFVTGVGLLVTFIAILIALGDLHADPSTGQISGIPQLLSGLSGKFISSVVALFSASTFLVCERHLIHRAERDRQGLVDKLDDFVPRLTRARILLDVKHTSAEQLDALRELLTGMGSKLREGLNESVRPVLERMITAIEELNQITRAAEAQRQDAVTSALKATLDQLNEGLQKSLASMSQGFGQSLVGEAGRSFDRVLASLESTAGLVERMNGQFAENQTAITALIGQARDSAGRQIELGRNQVEELSGVLRELMQRLNDAASSSVTQMNGALSDALTRMVASSEASTERITKLVSDLTAQFDAGNQAVLARTGSDLNLVTDQIIGKIDKFSEQIAQAVGRNAQATHASVSKVLDDANSSSRQNAERIAALLDRSQQQTERTASLAGLLNQLGEQMRAALPAYANVAKSLQGVAAEVSSAAQRSKEAAGSVEETAKALRAVQGQVGDLMRHSADQVSNIAAAVTQTRESMAAYEPIFAQVKTRAAELLEQVDIRLRQQVAVSRDGFEKMTEAADKHFANAANGLRSASENLTESLDSLDATIGRLRTMANGQAR